MKYNLVFYHEPVFNMKRKLKTNKGYFAFIFAVSFYLLFVLIFIVIAKNFAASYILSDIDRRLLVVAGSIPLILPEDYHDRAVKPGSISKAEWEITEKKLTELASASGVRYAWTDVLIDNRVFMTSCNRTEQTDVAGLELYYFMPYREGVSNEEYSAFQGMEPVYANFKDNWGSFRAVFVPCISPGGKKYLACAEYTIDYVDEMLFRSRIFSLLIAFSFFLAFLPVFIVYIRSSKSESRKLEKSELNLRITLNSIGEGVIVTNNQDIISMMNPAAEEISGWSRDEAIGKPLSDIFDITGEGLNDLLMAYDGKETGSRQKNSNLSATFTAKDKEKKIITYNKAQIKNAGEEITGSVIVFRDISEMINLEQELRQAQKMESIGQLAGGIAHDFNNMLGAIMGSADMLKISLADNIEITQNIDVILRASEKASDMTRKLLAFSRKGEIHKDIIDIHECINNTVEILTRSIDRRIEIDVSLSAEKSLITGDAGLIENAFLNMGINSRDAMPDGGFIRIRSRNVRIDKNDSISKNFRVVPGEFIEVEFSDNGSGIPKEIQIKIFEPFFTTKEKGKGTGLGMSLIYGTVKQHEGWIDLKSDKGEGTVFRLYFPVTEEGTRSVI